MDNRILYGFKIVVLLSLFRGCICTSYHKETIVAPPQYYSPPHNGFKNFAEIKRNPTSPSFYTTVRPIEQNLRSASPAQSQDKNIVKVFYTKPIIKGNETHYQIHLIKNNQNNKPTTNRDLNSDILLKKLVGNRQGLVTSTQAPKLEGNTRNIGHNYIYTKHQTTSEANTAASVGDYIVGRPPALDNPTVPSASNIKINDNKILQMNREHDGYPEESVYNSNVIQSPFQRLARFIDHNIGDRNYLYLPPKLNHGYNDDNHVPTDPFIELLLSHYGKYLPVERRAKHYGLYSYGATNNFHNNLPFGSYKVYEDSDRE